MLGKSTVKINLIEAILCVVVFALGALSVYYFCTASKNAKLEIANILNLENVNETTIDDDMVCYMERNGPVTITYKGQNVYYAYSISGKMKVVEETREITEDGPRKGMTLEITRDVAKDDKRIVKLMEHIDNGNNKIISVLGIICLVIAIEIFIFLMFGEVKEKMEE